MRRMKNDKGFTLAELLIVVAIIAVLVAVSIPIFTKQLEKAREATDVANLRAAKAAYIVAVLDGTMTADNTDDKFYYHADAGIVSTSRPTTSYGEGTFINPYSANPDGEVYPEPYAGGADYTAAFIYAKYNKSSSTGSEYLEMGWEGAFLEGGAEPPTVRIDLKSFTKPDVPKPPATEGNIPTPAP